MNNYLFPEQLISLVLQTSARIDGVLAKRKKKNLLIRSIYKKHGRYIKRFLNYNLFAEAFNQEFFLKNYLKALLFFYTLHEFEYDLGTDIFDVGCGASPGGIAFSQIQQHFSRGVSGITLLDKSIIQLNLAKKYCSLNSVRINKSIKHTFCFNKTEYESMVFFSYFICEQERRFIKSLYKHKELFAHGFAVVDYQHNINRIERLFQNNGCYRIRSIYRCYLLPESLYLIFQEKELFISGCYFEPLKY